MKSLEVLKNKEIKEVVMMNSEIWIVFKDDTIFQIEIPPETPSKFFLYEKVNSKSKFESRIELKSK